MNKNQKNNKISDIENIEITDYVEIKKRTEEEINFLIDNSFFLSTTKLFKNISKILKEKNHTLTVNIDIFIAKIDKTLNGTDDTINEINDKDYLNNITTDLKEQKRLKYIILKSNLENVEDFDKTLNNSFLKLKKDINLFFKDLIKKNKTQTLNI